MGCRVEAQAHGAPMHVCGGPYSHWCYPCRRVCVCACVRVCWEQAHGAPMHVCGPYSHWCYPCVCVRVSGAAEWRRRRMERQCMCAVVRTRIGVIHAGVGATDMRHLHLRRWTSICETVPGWPSNRIKADMSPWLVPTSPSPWPVPCDPRGACTCADGELRVKKRQICKYFF